MNSPMCKSIDSILLLYNSGCDCALISSWIHCQCLLNQYDDKQKAYLFEYLYCLDNHESFLEYEIMKSEDVNYENCN